MVFKRVKQMSILLFAVIIMIFFSGCVWNAHSEKQIRKIASEKLSKVNRGMTIEQVHSIIGEPDTIRSKENTENYRNLMKSIQNITIKVYPENLVEHLPNIVIEHIYFYDICLNVGAGFTLYFNEQKNLLGWDCDKIVLPDDWDDICARQEKLRLSTQSH